MVSLRASQAEKALITNSLTDKNVQQLIGNLLQADSIDIVELTRTMSDDVKGVENYLSATIPDMDLGERKFWIRLKK